MHDFLDKATTLGGRDLDVLAQQDAVEARLDLGGEAVAFETGHAGSEFGQHEVADLALGQLPRRRRVGLAVGLGRPWGGGRCGLRRFLVFEGRKLF